MPFSGKTREPAPVPAAVGGKSGDRMKSVPFWMMLPAQAGSELSGSVPPGIRPSAGNGQRRKFPPEPRPAPLQKAPGRRGIPPVSPVKSEASGPVCRRSAPESQKFFPSRRYRMDSFFPAEPPLTVEHPVNNPDYFSRKWLIFTGNFKQKA